MEKYTKQSSEIQLNKCEIIRGERCKLGGKDVVQLLRMKPNAAGELRPSRRFPFQREWPLTIDPAPGLTVSQITARARKHKQMLERQGRRLGPVIVDHMHIVRPSNRYSGARVNEVGEISAALKSQRNWTCP
jgi:replicative DNA helicase